MSWAWLEIPVELVVCLWWFASNYLWGFVAWMMFARRVFALVVCCLVFGFSLWIYWLFDFTCGLLLVYSLCLRVDVLLLELLGWNCDLLFWVTLALSLILCWCGCILVDYVSGLLMDGVGAGFDLLRWFYSCFVTGCLLVVGC